MLLMFQIFPDCPPLGLQYQFAFTANAEVNGDITVDETACLPTHHLGYLEVRVQAGVAHSPEVRVVHTEERSENL